MSKSDRIAHLRVENTDGLDPRYAGWFACFNRGEFYEAHDILEDLWLGERGQPIAKFHQGLIQLAGAFVHLQKSRLRPADALFRLAEMSLTPYGPVCESLQVDAVLDLILKWREALARDGFTVNPLGQRPAPTMLPLPAGRSVGSPDHAGSRTGG